jgi:hypothetical protein
VVLDSLPAGLFLVNVHLAYQHFCLLGLLHRFVVEGCSGLRSPWVTYPVFFLNYLFLGFSLACGVDFSLPPIDDRFYLWIDLQEKGTLGFSGCLLHPCDPPSACQRFFSLGASLTMGFLRSYHLGLLVVVFVLGSSPVPIHPFLVCKMGSVVASLWSVAIPSVSSFMGFTRLRAHPNNHGPLIKVYLLVLFHNFALCALGSLVVISSPILFPTHCTTIITTPCICTWVRCTHTRPLETLFSFILCHLLINFSSFPRTTPVLLPIDRTVVSYLCLLCDLELHCNLCFSGGLWDSAWILRE